MTPVEIQARLDDLGLSQVAGARLLGVDDRTMRRWVAGDRIMPEPAVRLLTVLDIREVRRRLEALAETYGDTDD